MWPTFLASSCTESMGRLGTSEMREPKEREEKSHASCQLEHREAKSHASSAASIVPSRVSCRPHMPPVEAAVDARRCAPLPPPRAAQRIAETCAAASGTIPLRLCKGPRHRPRQTFGARRPMLDRCLCGRSCHRWRNPACAAFPRATPAARVANRSGRVLRAGQLCAEHLCRRRQCEHHPRNRRHTPIIVDKLRELTRSFRWLAFV